MESSNSGKSRRTVSVYGPFYIGNNCLQLPPDSTDTETPVPGTLDIEPKRNSIDVSKYRIPTPKVQHRLRTSSSIPFSEHFEIRTAIRKSNTESQHDSDTNESRIKRYQEIGEVTEIETETSRGGDTETGVNTGSADSGININGNTNIDGQGTNGPKLKCFNNLGKYTGYRPYTVDDPGTNTTSFQKNIHPFAKKFCDTPFKISSTEDNYILNKYKADSCMTIEDKPVKNNENAKFSKVGEKQKKKQDSSSSQGNTPGKEYFSKHRLKIAKLKRKFFESLPRRDTPNISTDSIEIGNAYVKGGAIEDQETIKESKAATDNEMLTADAGQARHVQNEGFATESKVTMMKKYGSQVKERCRRYSSDGILDNHTVFSAGNWTSANEAGQTEYVAVVAIDFGTTYSGYAYSFCHEPDQVYLMRRLEGGDPGVFDQKIPTCLLLTPDGHFHSFGYTARDFYHELDPKEATQWMFLDRFKMLLHNDETLSKHSTVRSVSGREVSAMTVFSYSLAYFKDLVLQELTDQSALNIVCDVIRWVITVPAIWKASAKQFMRQAAYEAGIIPIDKPDQLLVALEPEAASIYCRRLRMLHLTLDECKSPNSNLTTRSSLSLPDLHNESMNIKSDDLSIGTQYMVVDCGGGTVDITVHQLLDGGRLKELHRASGGSHGSVGIDEEFEKLLGAIFGIDIIEQFQCRRPSGWVDLMTVFESRKRTASPYRESSISVSLPFSFIDFYKKCRGSSVESAVKKYGDSDISWSSNGMLKLAPGTMRRLFLPTMDGIKQAIGEVLNSPDMQGVSYMFLVGGFAESSMVQHDIRKDFGSLLKVIIPPGVSMSILKGAVYFGLDPHVVEERCSCMTYGVGVLHRFDPQKHPASKRVSKDGIDWCTDIFDAFVKVNQSVALGDCIVRRYTPVRRDQSVTIIHIYGTEREDVTFVSDAGVMRCGTLTLKLDDSVTDNQGRGRREIRTEMMFGDTEIKVKAVDVITQLSVEASIDFMNF